MEGQSVLGRSAESRDDATWLCVVLGETEKSGEIRMILSRREFIGFGDKDLINRARGRKVSRTIFKVLVYTIK